jgi:hypothetical protein
MRQTINTNNFSEVVSVIPPIYNVKDKTPDNSNKSFLVPLNEIWKFNSACVQLTTSAVVGNRIVEMALFDPENDQVKHFTSGNVQAASSTVFYCFNLGTFRETTVVNGVIHSPASEDLYITGGYSLRFWDKSAIDPTHDDMNIFFQVMRYVV